MQKDLIHSAANITGGGIIENIVRSVPDDFTVNIDLSKLKLKIFAWIKSNNITDKEMLRTFNCGVGFCLIAKKIIIRKLKITSQRFLYLMKLDIFQKKKRINLYNKIKW